MRKHTRPPPFESVPLELSKKQANRPVKLRRRAGERIAGGDRGRRRCDKLAQCELAHSYALKWKALFPCSIIMSIGGDPKPCTREHVT